MNRVQEDQLKASLTNTLSEWLDKAALELDGLPTLGENVAECMAAAAFAVLRGMADLEDYMEANDLLKEE